MTHFEVKKWKSLALRVRGSVQCLVKLINGVRTFDNERTFGNVWKTECRNTEVYLGKVSLFQPIRSEEVPLSRFRLVEIWDPSPKVLHSVSIG